MNLIIIAFILDKSKPKKGFQYQINSPYLTEVQWKIYDQQFARNKDYRYEASNLELFMAKKTSENDHKSRND